MNKEDAAKLRLSIAKMLNEGASPTQIANELGCSRKVVYTVKQRLNDVETPLTADRRESNARPEGYTQQEKEAVLRMREEYGFGPDLLSSLIEREPQRYGLTRRIPASKIYEWLREEGATRRLVGSKDKMGFPIDFADEAGVIAMDEWGPTRIGGNPLYLVTLQDRFSRIAIGVPVVRKSATRSFIHAQRLAMKHILAGVYPTALWVDNGIGMSLGSGQTSQAVRFALSKGTRVVFNAPHQPWRNGRLENFHHRQEVEFWMRQEKGRKEGEVLEAYRRYVNFYNLARPHGGIGRVPPASRGDYMPLEEMYWVMRQEEERLEPQRGIIDMVRQVEAGGRIVLQEGEVMRVSELFAGGYLRVRFELEPEAESQVGKVIWQRGQKKEPVVVASFNHSIDRKRAKGTPLVSDVRAEVFEITEDMGGTQVDEAREEKRRRKVGKKK
jgi:transposase InsO family protein